MGMAAFADDLRRVCVECHTVFYARIDARYCSPRCKQRAYNRRLRERKAS